MPNFDNPVLVQDSQRNAIQASYTENRAFRGEYAGTNLIYRGFARPGTATATAKWQICRLTYDGANNLTAVEWPVSGGAVSAEYKFAWDDRAAYVYS